MYIQKKYYRILNSSKYDDIESIKRNYKKIIFDIHPDRGGDAELAKEVNIAWEIIKKHHIKQTRHINKQKTKGGSNEKQTKNTTHKTKKTTNKHQDSSQNNKTSTKNNNEDIELLCIGVVFIGIGLFLLSVCWPIGIIYFYGLYKYLSS